MVSLDPGHPFVVGIRTRISIFQTSQYSLVTGLPYLTFPISSKRTGEGWNRRSVPATTPEIPKTPTLSNLRRLVPATTPEIPEDSNPIQSSSSLCNGPPIVGPDSYFTDLKVLEDTAEWVKPYVNESDTFVDFSCGKNEFAPLLSCKSICYDICPASEAITRDWFEVSKLPEGFHHRIESSLWLSGRTCSKVRGACPEVRTKVPIPDTTRIGDGVLPITRWSSRGTYRMIPSTIRSAISDTGRYPPLFTSSQGERVKKAIPRNPSAVRGNVFRVSWSRGGGFPIPSASSY